MRRLLPFLFGTFLAVLLIAGPLVYASFRRDQIRNLHVVSEGVLYRSGQMRLAGLKRVICDYGIKTVITLRDTYIPGNPPPDLAEEKFCRAEELNYYRLPPRTWNTENGPAAAEPNVRVFLQVMDDPRNYPVLIHCCAGSHRTGAYCAIYRMEYEHWTKTQALAEMKQFGYVNLDEELDIRGYLENYRPRWQTQPEAAITVPDDD